MSFSFAIGDLRSSLQLVDERCRELRGGLSSHDFAYRTSGLILNHTLELNKAIQEIERFAFDMLEREDFTAINAVAKELEQDLSAGLHTLDAIRLTDVLGFRHRGDRTQREDLYPFALKLSHSELSLLRRVEIIKKRLSPSRGIILQSILVLRHTILYEPAVVCAGASLWAWGYGHRRTRNTIFTDLFNWPRNCVLIMITFAIFIALSCFLGVYFTVEKSYGYSMGDAFTLAGWVIALGAFISTGIFAYHYPRCKCWEPPKHDEDATSDAQELLALAELPG